MRKDFFKEERKAEILPKVLFTFNDTFGKFLDKAVSIKNDYPAILPLTIVFSVGVLFAADESLGIFAAITNAMDFVAQTGGVPSPQTECQSSSCSECNSQGCEGCQQSGCQSCQSTPM